MDEPVVAALLNFAHIENPRTPKTKQMQVDYDSIIGGDLTESVREMLQLGTQQRRLLVQSLTYAGSTPNPQNLIEAVDAYLPSLWKIQKSLEFSKDTRIKINKPLHFEWSSVLCNEKFPSEMKSQAQGVFVYEVCFLLVVRAISHYNLARQHIERVTLKQQQSSLPIDVTDPFVTECFKEAIKQLRTGAGLLEYIATKIISEWKKPPQDPLPETRPGVLMAMAQYYLCQAQRLFIAKALLAKKTALMPTLFLGLGSRYEVVENMLKKEISNTLGLPIPSVSLEFIDEAGFYSKFCIVLAYKYLSEKLTEDLESDNIGAKSIEETFGTSMGFMQLALKTSKDARLVQSLKTPQIKARFGTQFGVIMTALKNQNSKLEEENASVYYARIDLDNCDLPARSQYKFVMQVDVFEMPNVTSLSFEQIVRAPPGIDQKDFDAMTEDIKKELLEAHQKKLEEEAEAAKKDKKGGLFGFGGGSKRSEKKEKKPKAAPATQPAVTQIVDPNEKLEAPPGVDKAVFDSLPPDMKREVIADYKNREAQRSKTGAGGNYPNVGGNVW